MPVPTITLTDAASPTATGFNAAVSGSGGGAVVWHWQTVDGNVRTWETTAGGTGDGTTFIPTSIPGLYWAYAQTTSGPSVPLRVQVTTGRSAVATRCRDSIVATLKLLNLLEIGDNVFAQQTPDETETYGAYPCISVNVGGLSESNESGLDGLDYVVYPARVMVIDRAQPTDHSQLPKYEMWREKIGRAFRTAHLPDVPENAYVRLDFNVIIDPELPAYQHMVTGLVVRCVCREPRGIGA
jgi:ribosomal protein L30/L7E